MDAMTAANRVNDMAASRVPTVLILLRTADHEDMLDAGMEMPGHVRAGLVTQIGGSWSATRGAI
ncbi:hypothetical protein BA898_05645 [Spiribacter roseus]|nr:hypothetical protein BA898_05645 [Spiribacter roseus]